jgi:hypothetical protein
MRNPSLGLAAITESRCPPLFVVICVRTETFFMDDRRA